MPPAEERAPGSRHWPFSWRTELQDQRLGEPGRAVALDPALGRPSLRQGCRRALIGGLPPAQALVADRGCDAQAILDRVRDRGGRAHIPTQRDRKIQRSVDPVIYRQRNQMERFFCKLEHFRRVATRFDKRARNLLAAILLASSRIWLRTYESATSGIFERRGDRFV
ncbi:transposase [Ancylobacter sp. Lp-2]|uniref:transposase n=1 Tax=Ancylobacter sp. Lp-2 TaxID=2881339 RepID=UPI00351D36D9|nr:transposase [Ancylobacter sp. Lp-2]